MNLAKTTAITLAILLILFIGGRVINSQIPQQDWVKDGRLSYNERGDADFTREKIKDESAYTLDKIKYDSKGTDIYAHLYMPKKEGASPAVIILPAANAPKEGQEYLSTWLAGKGYAVLVLDQRGVGETKGSERDQQTEFDEFIQEKKETTEQLMIYDALKALDVLREIEGIDKDNIILEGESMGGRFAMVATALEPKVKGVVVISSSGYGETAADFKVYMDTINPDNYVQLISPRKIVMFHSLVDNVVPVTNAMNTFNLAKDPKEIIRMPQTCIHGFCDEIQDQLFQKLEEIRNS